MTDNVVILTAHALFLFTCLIRNVTNVLNKHNGEQAWLIQLVDNFFKIWAAA